MRQKPGKHTPFFEFIDAQHKSGCPICRMVFRATDRYLDGLLYEAVLDPDVRAKTKSSRGFCDEHVAMLASHPGRALGIALIYRDIIRTMADTAEKGRFDNHQTSGLARLLGRDTTRPTVVNKLDADQECPACKIGREAEEMYIQILTAHLDDERLYQAYAEGEGLCLKHFMAALQAAEDEETFQRLISPQVARYRVMLDDLDEYIRKRDHRFKDETYGKEGDVWLRAMNAVVGGAGMGLSSKWGGRRSQDLDRKG